MHKKALILFLYLLFNSYGCVAGSSELERTIQAQGQLLVESQQKISELQADVDTLRGQLEETQYQLNQTIERQKMILQQLAGGSGLSSNPNSLGDDITLPTSPNNDHPPSDLSNWTNSGNDKTDYNFIVQFVNDDKQNADSIVAFQKFIKNYPKSTYLANANYWLGQLYYKEGKKDEASFYYATVVKNYPSSSKAADSLYKVGIILLDKDDKKNAKTVFQQVISKYSKDKKIVDLAKQKLASLK
ncbi:tol-pal system protein YbgF [Gilliamella sp. B2776]|uniref:tol-pal system protein YbgF n=1 Tax=unclassified Gilliamella TaxID=2685620 RepID=UPI0022698F37|nr:MULTISPECIES: tol-pal system protein YbgF [unclassified Gilliamella]MCX8648732.1 tol-pal system protein YbgF [Gilliamella sp. B2779]MCX8653392.1 tol-pal system protein YbgF [Gilliamella sp. B2737]MCX8655668.1 tol-pal system protein YbgF [Gilliamella sp. B2894]MCX8690544.1 tol-pal system protein YbgF [Gilliamella sp. B2776]MCX8693495.1 tol-pal system protein YbgF [Gilliamella sp. B2881]